MGACAKAACCRRTPLIWAVIEGHKDVVQLLLEHKAEVEAKAAKEAEAATVARGTELVEALEAMALAKGGWAGP